MSFLIYILLISLIELMYLVGIIIIVGFTIGIIERHSNAYLIRAFGPRGVLVTAWIGTPVHEIGHLIQCLLWGHRVTRVRLLQINQPNGVLGYVEHQYNQKSIYHQVGNFFIGIGPILSGIGSLMIAMYLLIPETHELFTSYIQQHASFENLGIEALKTAGGAFITLCTSLFSFNNLINPLFWIFLIIAICISSHTALSKEDIRGSAKGLLTIFFLLVFINIIAGLFGLNTYEIIIKMTAYNTYLLSFSSIAVLFSIITLGISFLLYYIKIKI
ncbi:hypothetical protein [Litchfieldia alkalitelluris]|uniref:hypothetical protein n=1 Tax=Litchfieldia alkalitelluris TaxID=304268 RepID=UPI000997E572|nr:hypothetical protein [Litchfieldia alkalitelluris]